MTSEEAKENLAEKSEDKAAAAQPENNKEIEIVEADQSEEKVQQTKPLEVLEKKCRRRLRETSTYLL